jgi:hypothetical protein
MLFGPGSGRQSLRDLGFSLNRQVRKFYPLGLAAGKRSILADPNKPRSAVIFFLSKFTVDTQGTRGPGGVRVLAC